MEVVTKFEVLRVGAFFMKEILLIDVDAPVKHPWVKSAIFTFH